MTTPFEAFVNGELPKRVLTEAPPTSWTPGLVLTTTGVALGVEASEVTSLGLEPSIAGSGVTTQFWNGEKNFVSITASDVGAIPTTAAGIALGVATLDEVGKIPLSQIPASAIERVVVVADETARFALSGDDVQKGDVVDQQTPKAIYFVVDDANLGNSSGYSELVAGTAAAVAWSGVTGIPVILSDIGAVTGSVNGDVLQKVGGAWVNRTTAQLKTSLAITTTDISGLDTALGLKAPLESPTFTGTVTVPTATAGDSSTAAASTAFVAGEISANAQPKDATLTALAAHNTNGILVQTAADTFAGRSLAAGQGITILNPSAVSANPTISVTDTAVTPGTYGSAAKIPTFTADSMGRITSASEVDNGVFSDSVFRLQDNLAPTKQLAFELSGITAGQTRTITMPDSNVDLSSIGVVPAYTNTTPYLVGSQVTYLGRLYVCNLAHTSSSVIPDFTKFYPASGVLVTTISSGTYVPPVNTNVQEYLVLASGSFTYQSDVVTTKRITVVNTSTSSTLAITVTPDSLGEGSPGYTNLPMLEVGEQLTILGLTYSRTGQTMNSGLFKLRTTGGSGASVTFNTGVVSANKVITIPNVDVNLGKVPTGVSYDATTGLVTLANADGTTSSTTNTGAITDALFRIQSNTDATRKIALSAANIAPSQTRTLSMPDADVDLGKLWITQNLTVADGGTYGLAYGNEYVLGSAANLIGTVTFTLPASPLAGGYLSVLDPYGTLGSATVVFTNPAGGGMVISADNTSLPGTTQWTDPRRSRTKKWLFTRPTFGNGGYWIVDEFMDGINANATYFNLTNYPSAGSVSFNTTAVNAARTITVPNANVNLANIAVKKRTSINGHPTLLNGGTTEVLVDSLSTPSITVTLPSNTVLDGTRVVLNIQVANSTVTFSYSWSGQSAGFSKNLSIIAGDGSTISTAPVSGVSGTATVFLNAERGEILDFSIHEIGILIRILCFTNSSSSVYSDSFKMYKSQDANKRYFGFSIPALATASRVLTLPDADVNLGDLPSIATTGSNTLTGTRPRVLSGSSNTVSGTDNVIVTGSNNTLNTSEVIVEGADWYNTALFPLPRQTVKSSEASATTSKRVIRSTVCLTSGPDGISKYATVDGTQTLTSAFLPKSTAYDATKDRRATHKITAMVHSDSNSEGGFFERIIRVKQLGSSYTGIAASKTVVTDTDDFGLSHSYGLNVTLSASAGDALLKIVGTCVKEGTQQACSVSCVVESIYHIDT